MKMIETRVAAAVLTAALLLPGIPILADGSVDDPAGGKPPVTETILGGGEVDPQPDKTDIPESGLGSITVRLTETKDGLPRDGVKFALLKVADLENGDYALDPQLEGSEVNLNGLKTADELDRAALSLESEAQKLGLISKDKVTVTTDEEGTAVLADLSVGVYLLSAVDIAGYELISPVLLAIPTWDAKDGAFVYGLEVEPKHTDLPSVEVNKVDEETGKNITNKDFEFTAYDDKDLKDVLMVEKGDRERGTALFTVTYGTIYIKETGAPQGYLLSDEVVKVEFREDDTLWINDRQVKLPDDRVYSIVYKNSLKSSGSNSGANTAAQGGFVLWASLAAGTGLLTIAIRKLARKD